MQIESAHLAPEVDTDPKCSPGGQYLVGAQALETL
jgi:hypothetical protein